METIVSNIKILFSSAKKMPSFFKFMYGVIASAFIPFLLLGFWPWPDATYTFNDKELTYSEFWFTGMAPLFILVCAVMSYVCVSIAKGKTWSKFAIFMFWASIIGILSYTSPVAIMLGGCLITLLGLYIFNNKAVRNYYQSFNNNG
jgi:hypothetical protein